MPDDTDLGCRRSKRTRVLPLDWYRNERILYERRNSGEINVICHLVVGAALRCWRAMFPLTSVVEYTFPLCVDWT